MTRTWLACAVLSLAFGCVSAVPHVNNRSGLKLAQAPSNNHQFSEVVVTTDEERGELTVFGRVRHLHEQCKEEGHVDLTVEDAQGAVWYAGSVPIVERGGRRGWYGASFRARIPGVLPSPGELRLAFDDASCTAWFDCGNNRAEKRQGASWERGARPETRP